MSNGKRRKRRSDDLYDRFPIPKRLISDQELSRKLGIEIEELYKRFLVTEAEEQW